MRKFYDLSGKHFFALANSEGAGVAYPPRTPFLTKTLLSSSSARSCTSQQTILAYFYKKRL